MKSRKKYLSRSRKGLSIIPEESIGINSENKDSDKKSDWWNRADIIAKILSSIVIATGGILVGLYIQQSQISISKSISDRQLAISEEQLKEQKAKADSDKKAAEAQKIANLLQSFISKNPAEKKIAMLNCYQSVSAETCDNINQILAKEDTNPDVRKEAIKNLGASSDPSASVKLDDIAKDKNRPRIEREKAAATIQEKVVKETVPAGTYAFAASANQAYEFEKDGHGFFTKNLLAGLNGKADANRDNKITAKELEVFISSGLSVSTQKEQDKVENPEIKTRGTEIINLSEKSNSSSSRFKQIPVSVLKGPADEVIWGEGANYKRIVALIIGVDNYLDSRISKLRYPVVDAQGISELVRKDKRASVQLLTNPSKAEVSGSMDKLKENLTPDDLLIVYFAGHGDLGQDGFGKWLVADSIQNSESTYISLTTIKNLLDQIPARTKTLYIDACFSRVDDVFRQPSSSK